MLSPSDQCLAGVVYHFRDGSWSVMEAARKLRLSERTIRKHVQTWEGVHYVTRESRGIYRVPPHIGVHYMPLGVIWSWRGIHG